MDIKFDKTIDKLAGIPFPYTFKCQYCTKEFITKRPETKYCSNRCRQRAFQYNRKKRLKEGPSKIKIVNGKKLYYCDICKQYKPFKIHIIPTDDYLCSKKCEKIYIKKYPNWAKGIK